MRPQRKLQSSRAEQQSKAAKHKANQSKSLTDTFPLPPSVHCVRACLFAERERLASTASRHSDERARMIEEAKALREKAAVNAQAAAAAVHSARAATAATPPQPRLQMQGRDAASPSSAQLSLDLSPTVNVPQRRPESARAGSTPYRYRESRAQQPRSQPISQAQQSQARSRAHTATLTHPLPSPPLHTHTGPEAAYSRHVPTRAPTPPTPPSGGQY